MEKSAEMRWFFEEQLPVVEHWFRQKDKYFKGNERKDYYLDIEKFGELSFKIREGHIEIKRLINENNFTVHPHQEGILQQWAKWRFPLKENVAGEQIFQNTKQLIVLTKERLLHTYFLNGKTLSDKNKPSKEGCQFEYTRVRINDKLFFSIAFEAFGDPDKIVHCLETTLQTVSSGINALHLSKANSFSYPALIIREAN